jgi:peptide-methionine (S)-S-oxide reductase
MDSNAAAIDTGNLGNIEKAYFATGCFWGAERRFWKLPGVSDTSVGYMGGEKPNPSYEEVCMGTTNHAEIVCVTFDSKTISFEDLLAEFWVMHDPTSLNRQGGDIGTQYRSMIFVTTEPHIYQTLLTKEGIGKIVTQVQSARGNEYWLAEEYHQKYLLKNPNGYDCHSSTGVPYTA